MTTAHYGSWTSPISADLVASAGVGLDELVVDGDTLYWLEGRPLEGGRQVLCRAVGDDPPRDQTSAPFNVRTRVHEYGGGSYTVHHGTPLFSNFSDQRLYRLDPGAERGPFTPEPATPAGLRYADATLTPDGAWLVCLRESHEGPEVTNELVALPADGSSAPHVLASGRDFYASPRLDPTGRRPAWSPDGALHFISDASGWWNLYRFGRGHAEPLAPMDAEFAMPQWTLDQSAYPFLPDG